MVQNVPARNLEGVMTYISPEIKEKLEVWAKEEDRSISYIVARLIEKAVEEREQERERDE